MMTSRDRSSKGIFCRNQCKIILWTHPFIPSSKFWNSLWNMIISSLYRVTQYPSCNAVLHMSVTPGMASCWWQRVYPTAKKSLKIHAVYSIIIRWVSWARIEDRTAYCYSRPHLPKCKATKDHVQYWITVYFLNKTDLLPCFIFSQKRYTKERVNRTHFYQASKIHWGSKGKSHIIAACHCI